MKRILQRLGMVILLLLAVSMITFGAMNTLGDPLFNVVGFAANDLDNPESVKLVEAAKEQYYLDKSLPERYVRWLGDFATGDLGVRFSSEGQPPVSGLIKERLPRSLLLMGMAQVLALAIAIPWGVFEASRGANKRPGTRDIGKLIRLGAGIAVAGTGVVMLVTGAIGGGLSVVGLFTALVGALMLGGLMSSTTSFFLISLPNFALAVILYYIFALKLDWFPLTYDASDGFFTRMWQLTLPALTLALPASAVYQRLLRTDLITTLQEDFILMARAKGVSRRRVLFRHALRPSMFSVVTVFGINAGALVGGALVVESYFRIPGLGRAIVEAIAQEDFPVVLAIVMIVATGFVVLNLLVDIFYSILDPRVRS